MNIRAQFLRPTKECPQDLRVAYLDSLRSAQDALLEVLVSQSEFVLIQAKGEVIGYFALTSSKSVVEFYLKPDYVPYSHVLFRRFVAEWNIRSALIKTFDDLALACALDINTQVNVRGMLVREYQELQLPDLKHLECEMRIGESSDFDAVRAVEQDVFSHPERLRHVIAEKQLQLFLRDEKLVGFGIIRPIIVGRPDVEIGIAVDTPYRNKGYAVFILRDLVKYAISQGQNPVSGCARENEASIRLGLRIGFRSSHRLVEVRFDGAGAQAAS